MNLSKKSTFPLFESICVQDGSIQNLKYHQERFAKSFKKFYWEDPTYDLLQNIEIPEAHKVGKVKLRVSYNKETTAFSFSKYSQRPIRTIKLIHDDLIDYDLKFDDRGPLDQLFEKREDCDDVLIIKNKQVTDCSYANIAFFDGIHWFTPKTYLLKGTKRTFLLEEGHIQERVISTEDLNEFKGFQLINAMLDFNPSKYTNIAHIHF